MISRLCLEIFVLWLFSKKKIKMFSKIIKISSFKLSKNSKNSSFMLSKLKFHVSSFPQIQNYKVQIQVSTSNIKTMQNNCTPKCFQNSTFYTNVFKIIVCHSCVFCWLPICFHNTIFTISNNFTKFKISLTTFWISNIFDKNLKHIWYLFAI